MHRRLFLGGAAVTAATLAVGVKAVFADGMPKVLDGLVLVKSAKLAAVWLLPGADFAIYDKVLLTTPEVGFKKDWVRNYNDSSDIGHMLSDNDAQRIMTEVRKGFDSILTKTFEKAGFAVVTAPAKDVLMLRSAVLNLQVTAPDIMSADWSQNYASSAGIATVVLEARDSLTLALLGKAEDAEVAGDTYTGMRDSVTNHADFEQLGQTWANACVKGLEKLKANPPPPAPAAAAK